MKIKGIIVILMLILSLNVNSQTKKTTQFLDKYEKVAVELMEEYNIPASVILGVSMLESGYGTSNVSQTKNNYFGVRGKKNGVWGYKIYKNDTASFNDFCEVLSRKKYYDKLTGNEVIDYNVWLDNINKGGYAECEYWHERVIYIVKKYELYKLDDSESSVI